MIGGDGSDVYVVDEAGDMVTETAGLASGIDRVESDIDYTLGANVENLDLNGGDASTARATRSTTSSTATAAANQLFGGTATTP